MPNISSAKPTKRRLLSNVVHSIMLYGSPFWAQDISKAGWTELAKVQRRICLRVVSAYCTVSRDVVGLIAGIAPIDLLAKDWKRIYQERKSQNSTSPDEDITSSGNIDGITALRVDGHTALSKTSRSG